MTGWPGYGLPVPANLPAPNKDWGSTRSPIYTARNAAEVDAIVRAQSGAAVDFTPSFGWHFDEEGLGTAQANDYISNTAHLYSQGASATRVQGPTGSDDKAVTQVISTAAGAWRCNDVNHVDMTTGAFAFAARMRFSAAGAGAWFISKSSNLANGYWAIGTTATQLSVSARATDATTAGTNTGALNYYDNVWRWVLFGRETGTGLVWVYHPLANAQAFFANGKSVSNTTSGAYFGLWFNLFGTGIGGNTCDISELLCWKDAAANNIYNNRATLVTALENPA